MGVSLPSGGGASGRSRFRRKGSGFRPVSDINVTPLVDVMLVLLIVFMVTAPLLTVGVPVDLPKTTASEISEQTEPLVITVNKEGKVFLQETEITLDVLGPRLQAITAGKPDTRIFVRGDQGVNYGRVLEVMGTLTTAGFTKVALIAQLPEGGAPASGQTQPKPTP